METFIPEIDVLISIKKHKESLSYDELFDIEMETSRMKLSDKKKKELKDSPTASEIRMKRYGIHKNKNK